jgi:nitronate monooxygenase
MIGGMGVDISTADLALEAARLGGVGHISDAMVRPSPTAATRPSFVKDKLKLYKYNVANLATSRWSSSISANWPKPPACTSTHTMEAKQGSGMVFINCMEKLTMNAPKETLKVRLNAALDAGIDGITLAAGLHLGSFGLIEDHPRFRDAKLGIIVSSLRACSCSSARTPAPTACPTTWSSKARWPAATWASAWTGRSTTWPPSSPRSRPG